ncbi:MAG: CRISPR-associated endonuclease Cas1 [Rhodoferax sp.]|nr:CRISPR-associated endonuclease Cas1 [Rhodoferax sp.]
MALLLLDRAHLEIKAEGQALALYEAGERRGTFPVKLVDRCVIHGMQTRLDTGVLLKLAEAGASVVLMSPRQIRRVAILLGPAHNDAGIKLAQSRWVLDDDRCREWSTAIVRAKLSRQLRCLRHWSDQRPDARKPLWDAMHTVQASLQQLPQKSPYPALSSLRGIEGAAARAHFAGLAAVLPPSLGFSGRNRRPPRDPVNACLSLAYTLLHVQAIQACHGAGLDPLLGFYHRPAIGRESLASDLIEPLRVAVDHWIWDMLRQRILRSEDFTLDKGACLLGKTGRSTFYAQWERAHHGWKRWLRRHAQALARELRQEGNTWLMRDEADEWP